MFIVRWCKRLQISVIACSALLAFAQFCGLSPARGSARSTTEILAPDALLEEANRLAWLGNWYRAGAFYSHAEAQFSLKHDQRNERYAEVGRLRANSQSMPADQLARAYSSILNDPVARADRKLRLWCLAAKGYTDINLNSAAAKKDWTEALQIATELEEEQWAARATGELGTIAFLEGDTARAVSLIGKAIFSSYKTGDIDAQIRLLSMLGNGFNEEHRFPEALIILRRAVSTAQANPDAGYPFIAYTALVASLIGQGDYPLAEQTIEQTLDQARTQHMQLAVAEMLMLSGDLALVRSDLPRARSVYAQAGDITRKLRFIRGIADTMFPLASVEQRLGDRRRAVEDLQIGLAASRKLGDRYYLPRDLTALAELKIADRRFREAESLFDQAEDMLDDIIVHQHSFQEGTAHAGSMSATYLEHFRLEEKLGQVDGAFRVIERVRGRTVAGKLSIREQTGPRSPAISKIENDIAATQLSLLQASSKSRSDVMEKLLGEERRLAYQLNDEGLNRIETLPKPPPLQIIQKSLRPDEVLAEYVLDEPASFCIVVSRSSKRLITLPAGSKFIWQLVQSYLGELNAHKSGDPFSVDLYRLLLAPVVNSFPEPRLIISADGVLYGLPFEALKDENGFVVRSKIISYTPSGSVLWHLRKASFHESPRPLLAVGAVDYKFTREFPDWFTHTATGAAVTRGLAEFSGAHLNDLPGSRNEVLAIQAVAGPDAKVLLGQNATETRFKSEPLPEFRIIHLATHASADPQYPDRAALILGVAPKTPDDGLLQVREIMGLSLNADLVTLSACETSIGADRREAGVVNLEEAFLIAGARAVLASFWNVEDNSTTALMKAFYQHLANREDKALALTNAKRDILNRYGDTSPYYWAGFVMVGQGAEQVPFGK